MNAIPPDSRSQGDTKQPSSISSSRPAKIALLVLTMLYLLGAIAASASFLLMSGHVEDPAHRKLLWHGLHHLFLAAVCGTALILVIRQKKGANAVAGFAAGLAALEAARAMVAIIVRGYPLWFTFEPLLVLPSAIIIIAKAIPSKKPPQQ